MELPLSKLFTLLNSQLNEVFDYVPGVDANEKPPTTVAREGEMMIDDTFLQLHKTMKTSDEEKEGEPVKSEG
jgi:hypothetical protein